MKVSCLGLDLRLELSGHPRHVVHQGHYICLAPYGSCAAAQISVYSRKTHLKKLPQAQNTALNLPGNHLEVFCFMPNCTSPHTTANVALEVRCQLIEQSCVRSCLRRLRLSRGMSISRKFSPRLGWVCSRDCTLRRCCLWRLRSSRDIAASSAASSSAARASALGAPSSASHASTAAQPACRHYVTAMKVASLY